MDNGSKFTHLRTDRPDADRPFYSQNSADLQDFPIESTAAILSDSAPLETHSERISCFIAELDSITKRVCEAARKGAERADRIEGRLLHELANLRGQVTAKDESLLGLEMALGELQRANKNKITELERRVSAQEEQIGDQCVELQELRSGRDYLNYRINEAQAAAKAARLEATRIKERWQSEAVEHQLKVAEYESWLSEKHLRIERLENETRTTIDELKLRLRRSEENLASPNGVIQSKAQVTGSEFNGRAKNLESPRTNLQATRKTRRAS